MSGGAGANHAPTHLTGIDPGNSAYSTTMELKEAALLPSSPHPHRVPVKTEVSGRPLRARVGVLAVSLLVLTSFGTLQAADLDKPKFRNGLWRFERTVEYVRRPPNDNLVLSQSNSVRCVDPNVAMTGIFSSASFGHCRSDAPQRLGNQYVFSNRCDIMGPVSTVITAESDSAYSEVNLLVTETLPKRDTVIAHRIGDCGSAAQVEEISSAVRIVNRR